MTNTGALTLYAQGEDELVISRTFNAPRQMVFDAHTKPELLRRWLGVRGGWTMVLCEVDLQAGGAYRYGWRNEAKAMDLRFSGVFTSIDPPEGFVCTEIFEEPFHVGEALNTYTFAEENGQTTLTIVTRYPSAEVRDQAMKSGMERGMNESYAMLDALLA